MGPTLRRVRVGVLCEAVDDSVDVLTIAAKSMLVGRGVRFVLRCRKLYVVVVVNGDGIR